MMRQSISMILLGILLAAAGNHSQVKAIDCYTEIDPSYWDVDVLSLIHINTPDDAARIRQEIINYFWPRGFPAAKMPASVLRLSQSIGTSQEIPDWILSLGSENLDAVDRLDIAMDYDLHSYAYLLVPKVSNQKLLIFQQGHSEILLNAGGHETVKYFLDKGYAVLCFWMPMCGENTLTARNVPGHGSYTFPSTRAPTGRHAVMSEVLDNSEGCFIRFFIEPVIVAINYVEKKYNYHDINMVGISGGGWTTHVCAAIDPRIELSFAVAGSLPLYLRRGPCPNGSQGDEEQEWAPLFEQRASWLDIYILAGWGENRGHVHILNQYDACCFWGVNYRTFEPFVTEAVRQLGEGFYNVFLDSSHRQHKISRLAIEQVIARHLLEYDAELNVELLNQNVIELPENLPFVMEKPIVPSFPDRTFDIRDYGAKHGGKIKNTKAIAEAIAACHKSGGGKVLIPEGVWLTGPIHLKSNINLHVAEGAEVHFSRNPDDYLPVVFTRWEGVECYNYSPLIYAKECSNIAITGKGVFDGQGNAWRSWQGWQGWERRQDSTVEKLLDAEYNGIAVKDRVYGTKEAALRPQMIQLVNCTNVLLEDYTSRNSPFWNNHLVYCDGVVVRNIRLLNPKDGPNTDGINLDSSRNVYITGVFADVGDDAVCIKSGMNEDGWRVGRKSENIVVENCHVKDGHGGIVFGSDSSGGIQNVYVRNCEYDGTLMGIRMKSRRGRGGGVEDVWIENMKMKNIGSHAIVFNMFYAPSTKSRSNTPPIFRNIHIKDVTCEGAGSAVTLRGLPEKLIENITLENVTITANSGLSCSDAKNIKLTNVNITPKRGPVITLKDSRSILVKGSTSPKGVETFLHVKGPKGSDIRLVDTDLSNAAKTVMKESEVPDDAVTVECTAEAKAIELPENLTSRN